MKKMKTAAQFECFFFVFRNADLFWGLGRCGCEVAHHVGLICVVGGCDWPADWPAGRR